LVRRPVRAVTALAPAGTVVAREDVHPVEAATATVASATTAHAVAVRAVVHVEAIVSAAGLTSARQDRRSSGEAAWSQVEWVRRTEVRHVAARSRRSSRCRGCSI
jgi:hypothetical protein